VPHHNVETLRAFLATWSRKNWTAEALERREVFDFDFLDPDIVYEDDNLPDHAGETYRGHEGVVRAGMRWVEAFESLFLEFERIVGSGERLVSIHRVRTKGSYGGLEFEFPLAYVWTFRHGKVIHFRSVRDPEEAIAAAGLVE
jgi:ketosteroid isomerase-like protein